MKRDGPFIGVGFLSFYGPAWFWLAVPLTSFTSSHLRPNYKHLLAHTSNQTPLYFFPLILDFCSWFIAITNFIPFESYSNKNIIFDAYCNFHCLTITFLFLFP